jgi:hypothetical protein
VENPVGNYTSVIRIFPLENQGFPQVIPMTGVTRLCVLAIKSDSADMTNPQGCQEKVICTLLR